MRIDRFSTQPDHFSMEHMTERDIPVGNPSTTPRKLTLKALLQVHSTQSTVVAFGTVGGVN